MKFFTLQDSGKEWLVWAAAFLITLSAIGGILTLHRQANESHRVVNLLKDIEAQVNRLNALEWEAVVRKSWIAELKESQQFVRRQVERAFDQLTHYVDAETLEEIRRPYRDYLQVIDEEFRLLDAKRFAEAMRVDEGKVDPAYDALVDVIAQAQMRYANSSRWTILAVDVGSSSALILAAISIGYLFSRFEQVQRVKQVLLAQQDALRTSEERFRSLVHNSSEIIAILNPLPPTVRFVSDSIRRILGHQPADLIGTDISKLIHPRDAAAMQRFLASCAFSAGSTYMTEVRIRRSNGEWCPVEIIGDNRVKEVAIRGIVINFHDISERKSVEDDMDRGDFEFEPSDRKLH